MHNPSSDPLISVVIPTYNSREFVRRTLASVVGQTYRRFEVVVSDDGSTDDTCAVVEEFLGQFPRVRWRFLRNPHGGPGAARNAGVTAATGEWVSFLDSDDVWFPEKLACVAEFIGSHPDSGLLCHDVLWLQEDGSAKVVNYHRLLKPGRDPFLTLFRRNILATSAVTTKRSIVMVAGLFDPSLPNNQDYDLWLRIGKLCRPDYLKNVLTLYKPRKGSVSTNHMRRATCMLRIGEKYFSELNGRCSWPAYERRRFRCRAYLSSAKALILSSQLRNGALLALRAAAVWLPLRQH